MLKGRGYLCFCRSHGAIAGSYPLHRPHRSLQAAMLYGYVANPNAAQPVAWQSAAQPIATLQPVPTLACCWVAWLRPCKAQLGLRKTHVRYTTGPGYGNASSASTRLRRSNRGQRRRQSVTATPQAPGLCFANEGFAQQSSARSPLRRGEICAWLHPALASTQRCYALRSQLWPALSSRYARNYQVFQKKLSFLSKNFIEYFKYF